jgi:hypothetical protein
MSLFAIGQRQGAWKDVTGRTNHNPKTHESVKCLCEANLLFSIKQKSVCLIISYIEQQYPLKRNTFLKTIISEGAVAYIAPAYS